MRKDSPLLVRHLVWHDVCAQRYPLIVFAAYLLGECVRLAFGTPWLLPSTGGELGVVWMPLLRLLLTAALTVLVVQQDSLVGTSAFWRTRPLARGMLLVSKTTTLVIGLVLMPGLMHAAAWAFLRLYGWDVWRATSGLMIEQALIVLLAAMAAILTPTPTYAVVAGVAGVTMVSLFSAVGLPMFVSAFPSLGLKAEGFRPTIYCLFLFVLGVPAIVHQFLRLREWRTALLILMALLGATSLARFWPASTSSSGQAVNTAGFKPSTVTVTIPQETLHRETVSRSTTGTAHNLTSYSGVISLDGVPAGTFVVLRGIESRLMLRNRTLRTETRPVFGSVVRPPLEPPSHDPMRSSVAAALWPTRISEQGYGTVVPSAMQLMAIPEGLDRANQGSRPILSVTTTLEALEYRVVASSPVRPGARLATSGLACAIVSVDPGDHMRTVNVSCAQVAATDLENWGRVFLLRNAGRSQAIPVARLRSTHSRLSAFGFGGVSRVGTLELTFNGYNEGKRSYPIDDTWLAGAELLVLEPESLGTFRKTAQVQLAPST
jgi:hypothetical protein